MTDQPNDKTALTGDNGQPTTGSETSSGKTAIDSLPPDIQEYIRSLRKEAEDGRKEKRTAEKAARDAEEKRLTEQQEWKKLADARSAELEKLKPVADQYESITAAFNASLDSRLKQVPDDIRKKTVDPIRAKLSPVEFSDWLDANMDILRSRQAPSLDGGAGNSGGKPGAALTDLQMQMAANFGMTPEQYTKYLNPK